MNALISGMMLAALVFRQVPLPELPIPPSQTQPPLPDLPGVLPAVQKEVVQPPPLLDIPGVQPPKDDSKNGKGTDKPPLLAPLQPGQQGGVAPPLQNDAARPPAFRIIENVAPPVSAPQKAAALATAESMPPGSVATPSLVLLRTTSANVKVGQAFFYEITVKNVGAVGAGQVRLEEELPPSTRFVTAQPMPIVQESRLTWTMDSIPAGAERRFRIEVEANDPGEWRANATLTAAATSTLRATVTGAARQAITMTCPATVRVGQPVEIKIRVTNTTGLTLTDGVVRVQLGAGLQHVHGDAIEGPLGQLAPGQTRELSLDAVAAQPGRLSAEAKILSGKRILGSAQATVMVTEQTPPADTGPALGGKGLVDASPEGILHRTSCVFSDAKITQQQMNKRK